MENTYLPLVATALVLVGAWYSLLKVAGDFSELAEADFTGERIRRAFFGLLLNLAAVAVFLISYNIGDKWSGRQILLFVLPSAFSFLISAFFFSGWWAIYRRRLAS